MDKKRVLVIEDNKKSCDLLVAMLSRRKINGSTIGAECAYSFSEGRAAFRLRLSQGKPFDAVVSDLHLPDSEPFDTIPALKKMCGEIPLRALTGLNDPDIIHACRENGIRLILKGTSAEDIMEEILYAIAEREPSHDIDHAIAANKPVTREIETEPVAIGIKPFRFNWKWMVGSVAALIPIITFCFTAGASLYKGLNDKAENRVKSTFTSVETARTIDAHTAQITDVQLHVRKLEDNQIEQKTKLDNITTLLEKVDRRLDPR